MKLPIPKLSLSIVLFWAFLSFNRVLAQSDGQYLQSLIFAAPPPPDNLGEPGRRSDAGSRGCGSENQPLTALVPVYKTAHAELVLGVTTASHPTFWFYVPSQDSSTAKFVLRDKTGNLVYQTDITLPKTSGVVSFSLPSTEPPLEIGQPYHWYFKIYCESEPPPLFVDGWIQRNPPNPTLESQLKQASLSERVKLYATSGIWYDALMTASVLHQTNPNDRSWMVLLQAIGLDELVNPINPE